MTRVLFVSTSTTLGGAEKTLFTLATGLDPKSFAVAGAVSVKPAGVYARRLSEKGVPVWSLGLRGLPGISQLGALREIIAREKPDVVHALMYQAIQLCRLAKRLPGPAFKLVSSPRVSYRTRSAATLLIDRLLKGADDLLIAESNASREHLVGSLGYAAGKVRVVYNGVSAPEPAPGSRERLRAELEIGPRGVLVGAVGRLDEQKGHDVLIESLALVKDRPDLRVAIVGEGPRRPELEALIRARSLVDRVTLAGEREELSGWLSALDVFVLPSRWEGLPNALLEAMALGLPVIASAVDGAVEAVEDGRDGLLVPPEDPAVLARAIEDLAEHPARREALGRAARAAAARKFGLARMLADYEAAYRSLSAVA